MSKSMTEESARELFETLDRKRVSVSRNSLLGSETLMSREYRFTVTRGYNRGYYLGTWFSSVEELDEEWDDTIDAMAEQEAERQTFAHIDA
jgi:hypothetical protein